MMGVVSSAKLVMDRNMDEALWAHIELLLTRTADAFTTVDSLLEKNGNVIGLLKPSACVSSEKATANASTDMDLTPWFWDSQASRTVATSRRKPTPKAPAAQFPPETVADTANDDCGGLAPRRPPVAAVRVFKQGTSYPRQER